MNKTTRLILAVLIGISAIGAIVIVQSVYTSTVTTRQTNETAVTLLPRGMTPEPRTPIVTQLVPTIAIVHSSVPATLDDTAVAPISTPTHHAPTPRIIPLSDFSATVTFTATTTEIQVGDVVTMVFRLTNTGKSTLRTAACSLAFYEEGKEYQDPSLNPFVIEELTPSWWTYPAPYDLVSGLSFEGNGVFRAVRPTTVLLRVNCSGKVDIAYGSTTGQFVGELSAPILFHIYSSGPSK